MPKLISIADNSGLRQRNRDKHTIYRHDRSRIIREEFSLKDETAPEVHLLICEACRGRVLEFERHAPIMRHALADFVDPAATEKPN